jgi:hypothetical protein
MSGVNKINKDFINTRHKAVFLFMKMVIEILHPWTSEN